MPINDLIDRVYKDGRRDGARQDRERAVAWHKAKAREYQQESHDKALLAAADEARRAYDLAQFHNDAADALERGEHER